MFEDLLAEVLAHAGARRGTLIGELLGMAPGLRLWQVRFGVGNCMTGPPWGLPNGTQRFHLGTTTPLRDPGTNPSVPRSYGCPV